jgi:hypothetical protein
MIPFPSILVCLPEALAKWSNGRDAFGNGLGRMLRRRQIRTVCRVAGLLAQAADLLTQMMQRRKKLKRTRSIQHARVAHAPQLVPDLQHTRAAVVAHALPTGAAVVSTVQHFSKF